MEKILNSQLNHRTIRSWKDQEIEKDKLDLLFNIANRTATSNGMQQASIIRVTDPDKKLRISKVAKQDYIANVPELLIFIVDNFRNTKIMEEKGKTVEFVNDTDRFFQGITDASIMAQNMVVAAEAMDLGSVYFGSILNDAREIIKILNLPEYTFPVVGLGLGYPNQEPQLKPRMDVKTRVFENDYKIFDSYLEELKEYDQEMTNYYDLRNANTRVDCFTDQVVGKNEGEVFSRSQLIEIAKEQGFNL